MGGIWAPPLKLADGIWFGVNGQWAGPATKFTSGPGYTQYDLPPIDGIGLTRTDYVPDGRRAAVFGLNLSNPGDTAKTVTIKVDVHSELLSAYPWAGSTGHPTASDNGKDTAAYVSGGTLVFSDGDKHAYVRADQPASGGQIADGGFRGPQPGTVCHDGDTTPPSACDDGPFGKGAGGELTYSVKVPERSYKRFWVSVAATQPDLDATLVNPLTGWATKMTVRRLLAQRSRVDLPGDRPLQRAIDDGKQNLADLTQTVDNLAIRYTDQGKQFPYPAGLVKSATFIGAGYPDYPWLFATDGEYTAFAAVGVGQFEPIEAHLRALQQVSDILNDRSGKVAHEIVTDGSVYFGANTDNGNTDESVKYPSALALVWRWTGDKRLLDDLYPFANRALHYVVNTLDADKDGWPEGLGNVERTGMGEEKLDNAVYLIRGLYDLADLARAKHDQATRDWALSLAGKLRARFDATWWDAPALQYADSLDDPGNHQVEQQHWIGVTPMEAELTVNQQPVLGLAPDTHALTALAERDKPCFSGSAPLNTGLFHTGCEGGPDGKGERIIYSLTTAVKAVADGNYGRPEQRRYTDANVAGFHDEMPGALPEVLPSPDRIRQPRALLDLPRDVHAGLGQLRHRLAGDPPATRRAPGHRRRPAGRRPRRPAGAVARRRAGDPARCPRHARRPCDPQREPLLDPGARFRRRGARAADRRHAPARRRTRARQARRPDRPPHRAGDEPRRRGLRARPGRRNPHVDVDQRVEVR